MRCPYCDFAETRVTDSRDAEDGIRRRRECLSCGQRFTTFERIQTSTLMVVKKDGRREEFSRGKLLTGLRKACEKRPLPAGMVEAVADDIEATLRSQGLPELPSEAIGELVMDHLRQLDHIAYIRFASVYREFADLDALKEEMEALAATGVSPGAGMDQPTLFPHEQLEALSRRVRPVARSRRRGRPRKALPPEAPPMSLPGQKEPRARSRRGRRSG
jgi:transcriptional repressor NrdR